MMAGAAYRPRLMACQLPLLLPCSRWSAKLPKQDVKKSFFSEEKKQKISVSGAGSEIRDLAGK
jgi:hypothetical protein